MKRKITAILVAVAIMVSAVPVTFAETKEGLCPRNDCWCELLHLIRWSNDGDAAEIVGATNDQLAEIVAGGELQNVTELTLISSQLTDLSPLGELINLSTLNLSVNYINPDFKIEGGTITRLFVATNENISLSFLENFINLERLEIAGDYIGDVTSLNELTKLKCLILTGKWVTDLAPLSGMTNLEILFVLGGQINDLAPIHGLTNLKSVGIRRAMLSSHQISAFNEALPECELYVSVNVGHVLGNETIGINDAVQVLMYLANMEASILNHCEIAYEAACITGDAPTIEDAVQILMYLAKMEASVLF